MVCVCVCVVMVLLLTWERNKQTDSQWSLCAVLPSINLWDDQPSFLPEHEGQPSSSDLLIKQLSLCGWGDEPCVFYEPVVNTDIFTPCVVSNFTQWLITFCSCHWRMAVIDIILYLLCCWLWLGYDSLRICIFCTDLGRKIKAWILNYGFKHDESWLSKTMIMQVYTVQQLSGWSGPS